MKFKGLIFLIINIVIILLASEAFAASIIDSTMCNASNIVTGPAGKAFASFAVISVGIGFFTGRISWGLMIGVAMGIATIYGAPTVVSSLTGKELFECQNGIYTTVCEGDDCYSCPVGYSGRNCDVCAAGFSGSSCSQCDVGYTGINCSQCAAGYYKINAVCKMDCNVTSQNGVSDTVVHSGNGNLSCILGNYSGSLSYSCDNGNFSVTTPCGCIGNYDVNSGCSNCIEGYDISSNCVNCSSGYTKVSNLCYKDCYTSGVIGIADNTLALPLSGSLSCTQGSNGSINYSCVDGTFSTTQSCFISSQCYQGGTHGTLRMNAPTGKVWTKVIYAVYGAVSNCSDNNTVSCDYPQRTVSVVDEIQRQCIGKNSCGVYINTYFASNLNLNVCDMRGNNQSINKLNVILAY